MQRLEHADELVAQAVLEGHSSGVDPAGDEEHFFVLDIDALDGPIPAGNVNVSGSLNGSVVYQRRPRSQTIGGLRHSSIVVQIEKVGANS